MPNIAKLLDQRVTAAMRAAYPDVTDAPAIVMASQDTKFGDYQANGAMGLAKRLKAKPHDVAAAIVAKLDVADLCDAPEIAGPGFINLRLKAEWLATHAGKANADPRLGVPSVAQTPSSVPGAQPGAAGLQETVVVDYSAPNLAKEMHVGHLRSTIIGDALSRMLTFAGHNVIRQNHVGDWGTQFGMLVAYLHTSTQECTEEAGHAITAMSLGHTEDFYRMAKTRFDCDPAFADMARDYVVKLQTPGLDYLNNEFQRIPEGALLPSSNLLVSEANLRDKIKNVWKMLCEKTLVHCRQVYWRLGVLLTDSDIRGESFYNPWLKEIVEQLQAKGMLAESEGAQCVFLKGPDGKPLFVNKEGEPLPLIVQKSDEGFLYATTDLAAIRYRVNELKAAKVLYTVDARQALHFKMVFEAARQAGFAPESVALEHIAFGTMMGSDGKPFKTREGGTVKLMDLLDEAETRAFDLVTARNPDTPEADRKAIARIVGIGAVKYADLSQNRTSDYVFSWEKMLALDGNTAPYMQYAYARVRSIFRKGEHDAKSLQSEDNPIELHEPQERALAKKALQFAETLDRALEDYRPNIVAAYLYDLAQAFTAFYDACPVLQSEPKTRTNRLKLCDLTARTIAQGLGLLGIETAERM
jgi:arginyl-tRNA synthetase